MAQKKIYLIRHGKASMEGSDRERNLDEDGKVIIGPRNFYGKKGKKGKDDSVYFSR